MLIIPDTFHIKIILLDLLSFPIGSWVREASSSQDTVWKLCCHKVSSNKGIHPLFRNSASLKLSTRAQAECSICFVLLFLLWQCNTNRSGPFPRRVLDPRWDLMSWTAIALISFSVLVFWPHQRSPLTSDCSGLGHLYPTVPEFSIFPPQARFQNPRTTRHAYTATAPIFFISDFSTSLL